MMHMKLTHNCISGMVGRYGRVVGCYVVMILPGNLRTTLPLTNPILVAYALADLHLLVQRCSDPDCILCCHERLAEAMNRRQQCGKNAASRRPGCRIQGAGHRI
jgi:hypothetical protein